MSKNEIEPLDSFDAYQDATNETAIYPTDIFQVNPDDITDTARLDWIYPALELGEAGEVLGKLKKVIRDKQGKMTEADVEAIAQEMGDILYPLARLAWHFKLKLSTVAGMNIAKLRSRKARGVLQGSGDNR